MAKYFLLGQDSIVDYKKGGPMAAVDNKNNYSVFKYDDESMTLHDLLNAVIGYDGYLEITCDEYANIKKAKNIIQWHEFMHMIDPDDDMTDGEMLDYIINYYKVPEFIHLDQL